MLEFYRRKIPKYYKQRTALEYLLIFGTLSSTILAFAYQASWAPITTAATASLTAWREFSGTDKKLTRYSVACAQINAAVLEWQHLTDVEKASHVGHLISTCEDILLKERDAWSSTSLASAAMVCAPTPTEIIFVFMLSRPFTHLHIHRPRLQASHKVGGGKFIRHKMLIQSELNSSSLVPCVGNEVVAIYLYSFTW
jgi:hypothetical protein